MSDFITMISEPRADFRLLDSGGGRKLEAYGDIRVIRPEPQAMWSPASEDWQADAEFVPGADEDGGGRWEHGSGRAEGQWTLGWEELAFAAHCTPFRHLGYFPDMAPVWTWMRGLIADRAEPECLNLFGYTGVGTLALSAAGARMVHVDASKKSVNAARDNAALSGMEDRPVRWIVEDARSLPDAKCGVDAAMTESFSIRPNMAAGLAGKSGSWNAICPA